MWMQRYRKKPIEVEAVQVTKHNAPQLVGDLEGITLARNDGGVRRIWFKTIHGDRAYAREGDWLVKEKKPGRYYPVKNDVFHDTYETTS